MSDAVSPPRRRRWLPWIGAAGAVACFHLAFAVPALSFLVLGYLGGLLLLARHAATPRQAFYGGLAAGLACVAPWLWFFVAIFGPAGAVLWGVVAFWTGLFTVLARSAHLRLGPVKAAILVPFLWTGTEYFRGELYPLKFTWLAPGWAIGGLPHSDVLLIPGVYGVGFVASSLVAWFLAPRGRRWWMVGAAGAALLLASLVPSLLPAIHPGKKGTSFRVAGLQVEGGDTALIPARLDRLLREHPETDLVVLPEYTFTSPVPDAVLDWCRRHRKYLIAGGEDPVGSTYRNTAFVVGPGGTVVFRQAKSIPIQFFVDGLPADRQEVWESPWGKVGICVCYDLSYARVVDGLVAKGAQVLVVPTMDVRRWGEAQHRLHARVAPVRAAEYRIPIVRVCSSGISQVVDERGTVVATAPFPGEGEVVAGEVRLVPRGRMPLDRWLAPFCSLVAGAWLAWLLADAARRRFGRRAKAEAQVPAP